MSKLLATLLAFVFATSVFAADYKPVIRNTTTGSLGNLQSGDQLVNPAGTAYVAGAAGTSGQVQYNSSGAFAGFTMAGDCTLSVPNITCLKSNGISFGYFATGTDAANLTGRLGSFARIPQVGGNSYLGNTTSSTADAVAYTLPDCHSAATAIQYTLNTGFSCGTITAATGGTNPFAVGGANLKSGIGAPSSSSDPIGSIYMRTDVSQLYGQIVPSGTVPAVVQAVSVVSSTVVYSASPTAGDLLIANCYSSLAIPSASSGWTDSGITANPGGPPGQRLVYKFAVSGESTSQIPCTGYSGTTGITAFEVSGVTNWTESLEFSTIVTTSPASHVTTAANELALAFFGRSGSAQTLVPTGFTQGLSSVASNPSLATAADQFSGSGSTASVAYTTGFFRATLIMLKPATAGWRQFSWLTNIKNAGTSIETSPISLNCSTGTTCSTDSLGAVTLTATPTTNSVALTALAQQTANTVLGNFTASTANVTAQTVASCSTSVSALKWTSGTGFGCTTLGTFADQNYATPPAIGGTTPAAGAFTTLSATGNLTTNVTGSTQCVQVNSSGVVSGTGTGCGSASGAAISGTPTAGRCASWLNSTTIQDAGSTCGGGGSTLLAPQGRLTLVTGVPVMTSDQTAKTIIYWTPYQGNQMPINGSLYSTAEISFTLNSTTHTSTNLFDVFSYLSGGVPALCTGPAWTNSTTRSAAVSQTNGFWVNTSTLTCTLTGSTSTTSVAAGQATLLGTFYATANGQTGVSFRPAAASGGSNAIIGLGNAYNRVKIPCLNQDSGVSYTYTTATWRAARASNSNRCSYVDSLAQVNVTGMYSEVYFNSTSANARIFIGMNQDSTTATPNMAPQGSTANVASLLSQLIAFDSWVPALGFHYIQAMEEGNGTATVNYVAGVMRVELEY